MDADTVSAPGRSNDRRAPAGTFAPACTAAPACLPPSRGISHQPAANTISATGAGMSSVQRQLTAVSSPESTRPSENPLPPNTE